MSHHRSTFPLSMTCEQLVRSRQTAAESTQVKSDCIVKVSTELAVAALAFRDRGQVGCHGCQLRPFPAEPLSPVADTVRCSLATGSAVSRVTSVRLTSADRVSRRGIALTVGPIIRVSSELRGTK